MNKKGQIITVDFVFSLLLLMLALGYAFRIAEANNYRMKEEELFNDLQRIGTAASERLVSSSDFVCEAQASDVNPLFIYNCVVENKINTANNNKLGIPNGYEFEILISDNGVNFGHQTGSIAPTFNPDNPSAQNIYSETRKVLWFANNPTKAQFDNCTGGGCDEKYVMLKVWKQ